MARYRVAVDTGGTFSDFVYLNEETGAVTITKVPSTPDDPSRAILQGIEALIARIDGGRSAGGADVGYFCHGTTVGTNALLEGKGVRTGLLVTEGFRGIYEVAEQARPYGTAIFDVMYDKPAPLVPQSRTGEVRERVDFRGNVLVPLDEAALRETLRGLKAQQIEALAVCLLFSFLHPEHEARVREIARGGNARLQRFAVVGNSAADPRVLPAQHDGHQRLSAADPRALHRQPRPPPRRRRRRHAAEIHHAVERRHVDLRRGRAHRRDHGAVRSGRRRHRRRARQPPMTGIANIITFDMGGTSCDVALIKDGEPIFASRGKIEGRDLAVPMMDINTVSAGGGTIATVDRFGVLEVGPHSAGAVPGPACYGRGGEAATITDCNLRARLSFRR